MKTGRAMGIMIAVCLTQCVASIDSAKAQFDITFGVDKGTKDLIQDLPDNIRQQVEAAIKDSLPLIDQDVVKWETTLGDILHNTTSIAD